LEGKLAVIIKEFIVGFRFLEPLRLTEFILIGSRRRGAAIGSEWEDVEEEET